MDNYDRLEQAVDWFLWKIVAPILALIALTIAVYQVFISMSDIGAML